jgi:hypothetical protein
MERQAAGMELEAMLEDLPKDCDVGTKRNSQHRFSCYEKPPKTHDLESPEMMSVRP